MDLYAVDGAIPSEQLEQLVEEIRRNPYHAGSLLADTFKNRSLTVQESAERIGVASSEIACVIAGRAPVTPELAVPLELAGLCSAEFWVALQSKYDLAQARQARQALEAA